MRSTIIYNDTKKKYIKKQVIYKQSRELYDKVHINIDFFIDNGYFNKFSNSFISKNYKYFSHYYIIHPK